MCDYFYRVAKETANGWYGALLSAHAYYGADAGFGYLNAGNRSSWTGANGGFRLYRFLRTTKPGTRINENMLN